MSELKFYEQSPSESARGALVEQRRAAFIRCRRDVAHALTDPVRCQWLQPRERRVLQLFIENYSVNDIKSIVGYSSVNEADTKLRELCESVGVHTYPVSTLNQRRQ